MIEKVVLTYDDLQTMPDDGLRRELLDGELYVTPAPSPLHQRTVTRLVMLLGAYAQRAGGEVFPAPIDVVFTSVDTVEPDVVLVMPDRLMIIGDRALRGAPSLIVEVRSASTADVDREQKYRLYARHRVPEYWMVDPRERRVEMHAEPDGERYASNATYAGQSRARSLTLPDLAFDLTEIV